ncbi:glycoside hydrolase family 52 protein [Fontivita pretiosa]|uniref:glycoside hydrolase family 52 protein n=1 Tax=Fontivita pretiosa TaxID=2989684 RepID=UPI003D17772F
MSQTNQQQAGHSSPPAFHGNISFNAQHSPMGAFMSFTCGHFGTRGGFGLQIGKPGNQDLYIGVKEGDRLSDAPLKCLPFYHGALQDDDAATQRSAAADFQVEQASGPAEQNIRPAVIPYRADQIRRHYGWATDRWVTQGLEFTIYTPFGAIPDPDRASPDELRSALFPGVIARLEIDNKQGTTTRTGFIAIRFHDPGVRHLQLGQEESRYVGFALRDQLGVAGWLNTDGGMDEGQRGASRRERRAFLFCRWTPDEGLREPVPHLLGTCPGIGFEVPPGSCGSLFLAFGCYLAGTVTTRLQGRYLYTRCFGSLEDVLNHGLSNAYHDLRHQAERLDQKLLNSGLSPDQQFLIAHATRSYYGSTQLLEVGGQPFWVVNEGEYCMMNTLDLAVDHVFWELKHNPWVVRNLLDNFVRYYSYHDQVKRYDRVTGVPPVPDAPENRNPDPSTDPQSQHERDARDSAEAFSLAPGGISFCHDMGVHNNFSPFGHSSYELPNLKGCFSYMTQEQLCNWILTAACYVARTGDRQWAQKNRPIILACLRSMQARRGKDPGDWMRYDSSRCQSGSEITTYDSLDESLGQARDNLYIAVKRWAAYAGLRLLSCMGADDDRLIADEAGRELEHLPRILKDLAGEDPVLPAVLDPRSPGYRSRILPAAEPLVYLLYWSSCEPAREAFGGAATAANLGIEQTRSLVDVLKQHTLAILNDPQRRNLFPDGGIRLSSTSNNSWMSKIAIFQHVAREVFHLDDDPKTRELFARADAAHVKWQTEGESAYWACSDQMVNGVAKASRYYPRIITTALWLND